MTALRKYNAKREGLTVDYALSVVRYEPETGLFYRVRASSRSPAGALACADRGGGYRRVSIDRQEYLAHRLAWFLTHGVWPRVIDHINGDPSDNRIANLRPANQSLNNANSRRRRDNVTGFKGVSVCRERNNYRAFIAFKGRKKVLGRFKTAEEAHEAYKKAAAELFGEFARVE